jgi:hypothetical protein
MDQHTKLRPPNLKLSPLAVVPQKDCKSCLILDLSFPVYLQLTQANPQPRPLQHVGVNDTTSRLAPDKPVCKIGNVFCQVFSLLNGPEADEAVMLSKIDLSDGFCCAEQEQQMEFCLHRTRSTRAPNPHCDPISTPNVLDGESILLMCRN